MAIVTWSRASLKELGELNPKQARRIVDAVNRFAVDGHGDVKHLQGDDALRLRVGDYRVIFDRVGDDVSVRYVSHRREAYRGR